MVFLDDITDPNEKPLYTLEELEHITELYLIFLEKNSEQIIDEGYTQNRFIQCPWLDLAFTNIYPTFGSLEFISRWNPEEDIPIDHQSFSKRLLSVEDAKIVDDDRASIYILKIYILHSLLSAMRTKNTNEVLYRCLQLLKKEFFDANKLKYYTRLDITYAEKPIILPKLSLHLEKPNPGGRASIFNLIIHYLLELEFGMKCRIRKHLGNIVSIDSSGCLNIDIESYFELIHRSDLKPFFDNAFYLELTYQDIEDFVTSFYQEKIKTFFTEQKKETDQTETISFDDIGINKQNVFCKLGSIWDIAYEKQRRPVANTKGMFYIRLLLENPGKHTHVIALEYLVHQESLPSTVMGTSRQETREEELKRVINTAPPVDLIDDITKNQIIRQIKLMEDDGRTNEDDYESLIEYLEDSYIVQGNKQNNRKSKRRKDISKRIKTRKKSQAWEQSRKRVRKCIEKAKSKIKEHHPKLWFHLNNAIKYKTYHFWYEPDRKLYWTTFFRHE